LENYAGVVRAVVRAGRPHLHGGSRLAAITPGTWVRPDGAADAWLVTGRRRTWSRDAGWQVELSGGFDPTALLTPTHIPATRGLVVARDAKASRVRVRLPLYDVELSLELVARVAGSDRLDVALPGVGDPVVVQWLEDCPTHGLLTGSPVRPGVMPESEFDAAHAVTRAAGFGHSLGADGRLHQTLASWQFVVQGVCDASAEKFDFKPYRK
jgi:hypothetical protein